MGYLGGAQRWRTLVLGELVSQPFFNFFFAHVSSCEMGNLLFLYASRGYSSGVCIIEDTMTVS